MLSLTFPLGVTVPHHSCISKGQFLSHCVLYTVQYMQCKNADFTDYRILVWRLATKTDRASQILQLSSYKKTRQWPLANSGSGNLVLFS